MEVVLRIHVRSISSRPKTCIETSAASEERLNPLTSPRLHTEIHPSRQPPTNMAVEAGNREKVDKILNNDPNVTIFLRPIAAPAALGLAGFAGSTWITAAYIAEWYGNKDSPLIFFPFVAFWGGLGQFVAGLFGYAARDTLVTVIHVLWGSFWMSVGLLYLLVVRRPHWLLSGLH